MENIEEKKKLFKILFVLFSVMSLFVVVKIYSEIKKVSMLGESAQPTVISVAGHGEVNAVPDIANIYFNIDSGTEKTVKEAQAKVAEIEKKALDVLKQNKIDLKDIKTQFASFNPKYENRYVTHGGVEALCTIGYCNNNKQVLVGYEASESLTIKVRNVDDVGKIMQALGTTGVSNLNGPNFSIDDEDMVKVQAKKKAIDDAKEKAEVLAKDLRVRLGKIASFSESGNYNPPYYAKTMMMDSVAGSPSAPAQLPKGENTISSDVTITYEIR
jgi:uncharacterized protein YggE